MAGLRTSLVPSPLTRGVIEGTFKPREIELVADFLMMRVVGKGPMDRAKCIDYWGSDVDACNEFPK